MNDNDNIKELIGARLEEIHLSETMTDTMPSDEEILRWETLAQARRAQKQRNKCRLLSMAAVFLLAIVVGVAVIVSPPDAEAGGDGRAVIMGNGDGGLTSIEYSSVENIPKTIRDKFVLINYEKHKLEVDFILYTKTNNTEQLEVAYISEKRGEILLTEIIGEINVILKSNPNIMSKSEEWGTLEVIIIEDPVKLDKETYTFIDKEHYFSIYTSSKNKNYIKTIIKEAF